MGLHELGHTVQEINVGQRPDVLAKRRRYLGGHGPNIVHLPAIHAELFAFQPELIILCAGGLTFSPEDLAKLRRRCPIVGMTLSDPDVFSTVSTYCHHFTYHTTNSVLAYEEYKRRGIRNTILMPFAVDSRFFAPRPADPQWACDVAVIGHANKQRLALAQRLADEFDVRFHGRNWPWKTLGPVHGEDWFRAAYSTRFLVNFPQTRRGFINVKVGVFEAVATGRLLFTQYFDEMKRYFEYDKEIIGYRDSGDLIRKIRYYLEHPAEAQAIAQAGQLRCAREHTWASRLAQTLDRMHIPSPSVGWNTATFPSESEQRPSPLAMSPSGSTERRKPAKPKRVRRKKTAASRSRRQAKKAG